MTLYRKYRPQTFADFINQKQVKEIIQNQIIKDTVSHAYLFAGPRGVGKTTMARLLAQALNCEKRKEGTFEPCAKCVSCREIQKGNSLDLIEQDAASNRGIEEIRSLRENVRISPVRSRYKIFIIDEAHMLTTPAFNALLKTLEEPPSKTVFILATTESHKLPETIVSRCLRFDFKKVPGEEIAKVLARISKEENLVVGNDILKNIAVRSEGDIRDSLTMLAQIAALHSGKNGKEISSEEAELVIPRSHKALADQFITALDALDRRAAFTFIDTLVEDGVELEQFTQDLIRQLREKMVNLVFQNDKNFHFYRHVLDILIDRLEDIKRTHFLPQLPLELAVLECIPDAPIEAEDHKDESDLEEARDQRQDKEEEIPQKVSRVQTEPLSVDLIKEHWQQVLLKSKEYNHSLPVALSSALPLRIDSNRLILGFKYKLHLDTIIGNQKNRMLVERLLFDVFTSSLLVGGEMASAKASESPKDALNSEEDVIASVREVFGE